MKKLLSIVFALTIILTVLPVQSFAKSDTVELYGNKISVHAKQVCFVKGSEEEDSLYASLYDSSFKKYYYVGDETVDFKLVAENLPELQNLAVICSDVKNLSSLGELKSLAWLGLHQCDGSEDLSFLKNLSGLKKFRYTNIYGDRECESLKPVANLKNLTELYLNVSAKAVKDISPIKGLTKLKKLYIENISGKNVSVIENLKNLRELDIEINDSESTVDLTFLENLKKLEKLDITERYSWTKSTGLSSVTKLKKLKELGIHDFEDTDLSFIGEMTQLESLSVSYSSKSFTKTIGNLKNLKELILMDINGGRRYDMSFLSELTELESLFLFGDRYLDISGISKLKKLKDVSIWLCEFDDLSELKKCPALEKLTIYNCNADFDVKWIEGAKIKELKISGGGSGIIKNMNKLATLKNLEYLLMDFTGISEKTAKKIKKAVPNCKIEVCELGYGDYDTVYY